MAIARVQSDTDTGSGTAPTATLGAGPAEGSLLVCAVRYDHATGSITARAGWTKIAEAFSSRRTCLLYRIAGAGEGSTLTPCDCSDSAGWACIGVEYGGIWRAAPLEVAGAQADNDTAKTSPAVDPADGAERLGLGFTMSDGAASWSNRTIGGVTATTVVSGTLVQLFERIWTTDGATVTAQATASLAADGTAAVALFRGQPGQVVQATAPSAATVRKAAARTLLLGLAASAGYSLLDLSGTPRCVVAAVARGLACAARSRRTTVATTARVLTFVAKDPCP